jgi:hypothetical protein
MKALAVAAALLLAVAAPVEDPWIGTWKLNEKKSEFGPGSPRYTSVTDATDGGLNKVTLDGVDAKGNPVHTEWKGRYDGKDYPVTGDPDSDMRSYLRIPREDSLGVVIKKDGKVVVTGKIRQTPDGKTRIVTSRLTSATGPGATSTAVYEKVGAGVPGDKQFPGDKQ